MTRILALVIAIALLVWGPVESVRAAATVGGPCGTKGAVTTTGQAHLECSPKLKWRRVVEGAACVKVAAQTPTLGCIATQEGRRWIRSYEYSDAACNAEDPTLAAARVTLPPVAYNEGRVAAACVALEWLANEVADYPALDVIAPSNITNASLDRLRASAEWQMRIAWNHRTNLKVTKPTMFLFDSIKFLCQQGVKEFIPGYYWLSLRLGSPGYYAEHPKSVYSCANQQKTWQCSDQPDIANGVQSAEWRDRTRSGLIQATCPGASPEYLQVTPWKYYLGFVGCPGLNSALCQNWAGGAAYIYSLYAEALGDAETNSSGANLDLCTDTSWMTWCPQSGRLFRKYYPSATWLTSVGNGCWPGSNPYGEDGGCTPMWSMVYHVRGYAFEWVTAHFGLDAAFGLINAVAAAKSNKALYLKILKLYTGMTPSVMFAKIDDYIQERIASRIR
jgi:hypothetical protein